jgi:hypothetical protein
MMQIQRGEIFCSYAHEDQLFVSRLKRQKVYREH